MNKGFDKATFKNSVIDNVKNMFRRTIDEATPQQVFQAVAYAVKDVIIDEWIATHKEYERKDVKTLYYLSMEFLMGRALGNNLINICAWDEVKEVLDELGFDLNAIEDQEPDAALGNGGLGRLAACFLDSLSTLGYPAYGCGIRYRYGMFKQKIENGYQVGSAGRTGQIIQPVGVELGHLGGRADDAFIQPGVCLGVGFPLAGAAGLIATEGFTLAVFLHIDLPTAIFFEPDSRARSFAHDGTSCV